MKRLGILALSICLVSGCSSKANDKPTVKEEVIYDLPAGAFVFDKESNAYEYTKAKREKDKVTLSELKEDEIYIETENDISIYTYECDDEICKFTIRIPDDSDMSEDEKFDAEMVKYYVPVEFIDTTE